ncbi:MAG: hypothetical protein K940chlam2_01322 [Chlamydiae bacterium]|nr:hypothetical protein [Chlamydiota bacterium]
MFRLDPTRKTNVLAVAAGAEMPPGEEISALVQEALASQPEMDPRPLTSVTVTPTTPEEFEDILFRGDLDQIVRLKEAGYVSELWDLWSPEDGVEALQFIHALTVNDYVALWHQMPLVEGLPNHSRILAMVLERPPKRNSKSEAARLVLIESQIESGVRFREEDMS